MVGSVGWVAGLRDWHRRPAAVLPILSFQQFCRSTHHTATSPVLSWLPSLQDRVFPHGDLDAFICGVERLSGTNAVKHHMHDTRMRLLRVRRWLGLGGWMGVRVDG